MPVRLPTRRAVLRGLLRGAAVTVALPTLECFLNPNGTALACEGIIPRRFGLFFWGNGTWPDAWTPIGEGAGDAWQLSEQLAPLAGVKDDITVVSGFAVRTPNVVPHGSGASGLLAARPLLDEHDGNFQGPTIDQIIAQYIGGETVYRSLETGASNNYGNSWLGANTRAPLEVSPYAFFERVFGETFREPGGEGQVDPSLALRQSVLDAVLGDIARLKTQVGATDAQRLDQHFTSVRELELRLARLQEDPPDLEACSRPGAPLDAYPDIDGRPQLSARSRAMVDLHVMALACDQTRVFSHWFTDPVSNVLFPEAPDGHHNLTHDEGGDQPWCRAITTYCVGELAYLIEALKALPEGDGSLLDNCAVLGCSELSLGRTHSLDELPIVIAGSACGALRPGLHVRSYSRENVSRVLLTLVRAMGIQAAEIGVDEAWTDQSLPDIEG